MNAPPGARRRWTAWRDGPGPGAGRATSLTSRRGLRVAVMRHDGGWAVRAANWPDVAWAFCQEEDLERTLGLTLGLDGPEASALAARVREGLADAGS